MQRYALGFFLSALTSSCFISGVTPSIEKAGKLATTVFTVLFIVTETMALFGA